MCSFKVYVCVHSSAYVGQNRYVLCSGVSVLGRCSIILLGGLWMYVSFKLGELVYVIGERVGENVMCGCRCVGWLRLWPSIVLHWWLCC